MSYHACFVSSLQNMEVWKVRRKSYRTLLKVYQNNFISFNVMIREVKAATGADTKTKVAIHKD